MAFEELDPEIAAFFEKGAQLPTDPPAEEPPAEDAVDPPAATDPPVVPPIVEPAPVAPTNNAYLERLLEESEARTRQLEVDQAALKAKLEEQTAPKAPDPNTDPLGYLAFKIEQQEAQTRALRDELMNAQKMTQADTLTQRFMQTVEGQVQAFVKDHQDYPQAYKYLVDLRMDEYRMRGMTAKQADEALNVEQTQIARGALQTGKNVGEVVYSLAQKYGFKAPAPAAPTTPESKLDTLKKGLETDSHVEKGVPPTGVSVTNVKQMSDRELNELVADDDKWAKLMGHTGKGVI